MQLHIDTATVSLIIPTATFTNTSWQNESKGDKNIRIDWITPRPLEIIDGRSVGGDVWSGWEPRCWKEVVKVLTRAHQDPLSGPNLQRIQLYKAGLIDGSDQFIHPPGRPFFTPAARPVSHPGSVWPRWSRDTGSEGALAIPLREVNF